MIDASYFLRVSKDVPACDEKKRAREIGKKSRLFYVLSYMRSELFFFFLSFLFFMKRDKYKSGEIGKKSIFNEIKNRK